MAPVAREPRPLHPALTASLIAAALHAGVSGVLVTPGSLYMLALVAAFLLAEYNAICLRYEPAGRAGAVAPGGGWRDPLTAGVSAAAAVAVVAVLLPVVWRDLPLIGPAYSRATSVPGAGRLAPRFWQHGWISPDRDLEAAAAADGPASTAPPASARDGADRRSMPASGDDEDSRRGGAAAGEAPSTPDADPRGDR